MESQVRLDALPDPFHAIHRREPGGDENFAFWRVVVFFSRGKRRVGFVSQSNGNRIEQNPWLIYRGVSPFSWGHHFWREHSSKNGMGLFILGEH